MGIQVQPNCCNHDIYFQFNETVCKCKGLHSNGSGPNNDYLWSKAATNFAIDYVNGKLYGAQLGSGIVYDSPNAPGFSGSNPILGVCNLDGSNYKSLVPNPVPSFVPVLDMCALPSLNLVVMRFEGTTANPGGSIWTCALDGTNYRAIYTDPVYTSSPLVYYTSDFGLCVDVGTGTVYFTRYHPNSGTPNTLGQILACNVYGGGATVLVDNIPAGSAGIGQFPWYMFSIDYTHAKIWFVRFIYSIAGPNDFQLCNMNLDGSGVQTVVDYGNSLVSPYPTVTAIRYNNGNDRIYIQGKNATAADALWSLAADGTDYRSEITTANFSGSGSPTTAGSYFRLGRGWCWDFDQFAQ